MPCVSDRILVPLSHCVHTGMHALIRVTCTCVDEVGIPISQSSLYLHISYLSSWMPNKTVPPVSKPVCRISRSAHGRGWTWFMSREECSLFVIPQDLWKDCSDYKQIWTVINWTHVVMYVALLHAKINTWHTFMGESVVMMSYCKVKPTWVTVVVLWFILLRSSSGKLQSNLKLMSTSSQNTSLKSLYHA